MATDPYGGLAGDDRDAFIALSGILKEYGLESLSQTVLGFIQQGYSADTIQILLADTDAYRKRFAANEARRQKGLPVLSPAEYLATEQAYRQVMSAAGLPVGFWDEQSDFETFLSNNMSPVELQQRVKAAADFVYSTDTGVTDFMRQWYTDGDLIAYALDPERAVPLIERQYQAARIGDAAQDQGMGIDRGLAERIAETGVDANQARQGFGTAAAVGANAARLSEVYGGSYTQDDAMNEVFFSDEQAARRRRGLASQERAQFSGGGGINERSLSTRQAGQV